MCKNVIKQFSEVEAEILSEEDKESGECLELRTISEVEAEIPSEEDKESGDSLELRTISEVEAEVPSEEDKESGDCLELRTISEVEAEILSEEDKESGECLELRTISEVEAEILSEEDKESGDSLELRTISEVEAEIPSEEDKESGECLELRTISEVEAEIPSEEDKESGECLELRTTSEVEVEILSEEEKECGECLEQRRISEVEAEGGQEFCLKRPTCKESNMRILENLQEVKEDHFEEVTAEHTPRERIGDKQDIRESSLENDDSDIEIDTTVEGEILFNDEVSSSPSEKMCLKSAYESYPGIERSRAVKDNEEDRWDAPECLQEEKSFSLGIGDFTVEDETEGKHRLPIKEELDVEITDALKTKEKNEPPYKNPKKITSQTALDTENIHETVLEVAYKTEADAGEVKSFVETPTYDYGTDDEMFKLKAKKEVDHRNTRYRLLEQQSVNIVMSEHALEEEGVDDQDFSEKGKVLCKIKDNLVIDVKNQPPDKNLKGVISENVLGVENSGKDSYQILNSTEHPSHNLDDTTSIKHCSIGLNASAKDFIPRKSLTPESIFRGADGGPSSQRDSKQNDAKRNPENASRLNAEAKEYIPPLQSRVWKNGAAGNSQSCMFPRDFVPSYVNNTPSQPRFAHQMDHAPSIRPVYRPASPHQVLGFRQRGHARMHHRRPSGRFPPNQPRMRFRHQNPPNSVR